MHVTKRVMGMNVDGHRGRGRPNKIEKGVDDAMTANRGEWKKIACCADPK